VSQDITKALQMIDEGFDSGIKLDRIAAEVSISYHHLCRKFKREVGTTIGEHIASLRIEHAKKLLADSSYSVAEISKKCGYGSTVQFHRMFERLVGDTPMQFRKKIFGES